VDSAARGRAKKNRPHGQALDHENKKTPISKPTANAQRPNVQAETTRTRLRRSCGISWVRSVIATAPPSQQLPGPPFMDASRRPGHTFRLNANSGPVCPACNIWYCAVRWPVLHLRVAYFGQHPALRSSDASARPRHQRAHGVLLEGQNRDHHQSGPRCSLRWMMRRRGKFGVNA
jgi:hypothetical protein